MKVLRRVGLAMLVGVCAPRAGAQEAPPSQRIGTVKLLPEVVDSISQGLKWLAENAFQPTAAGRTCWNETEDAARQGYAHLFADEDIPIDAFDAANLVLFPEMDAGADVPEITINCWDILGVAPETMMCATSRMIVKRRGSDAPSVVPCTLLPYDPAFELGESLAQAAKTVRLNHPHCAKFCVLGGASCSPE